MTISSVRLAARRLLVVLKFHDGWKVNGGITPLVFDASASRIFAASKMRDNHQKRQRAQRKRSRHDQVQSHR
jgi:hypothetical protein